MRFDPCRSVLICLLAVFLFVPPSLAEETRLKEETTETERGLTWMVDGRYLVTAGLTPRLVVSRAEALEVIARLNRGDVENFGFGDWRLPTARELATRYGSWGLERLLMESPAEGASVFTDRQSLEGLLESREVLIPVRGNVVLPGFSDAVIFATNSAFLKQNAEVLSGDVVVNDMSPGPTLASQVELTIGISADTPAGYSVKADRIQVKNNAVVGGALSCNELNGNTTGLTCSPLTLPVFDQLPLFQASTIDPNAPPADITVAQGDSLVLGPGAYGTLDLRQNSEILFTGGTYDFVAIDGGTGVDMFFDAPSIVRIVDKFESEKNSYVGPAAASGVTAAQIVFYVGGINGNNGNLGATPRAAKLGIANQVFANFYVPNGTIWLRQNSVSTGAFLGRDVILGLGATATLDSFFFNLPPEALDDSATVDEGAATSVLDSGESSVLANDSDANGDTLTVTTTPVTGPVNGTLTLASDGTFTYTHDGSETTSDSFEYEVCDDGVPMECDTATVSITVNPVNDPPVAGDDSATVGQGESTSVLDSGESSVLANDSDAESTTLTVTTTPVSGPEHGNLTLAADGTFTYAHGSNEELTDSFVYEVCDDGTPAACSTGTVTITVVPPIIVRVTRFGLGDGEVTSAPAGIDCGQACVASFPGTGGDIVLTAVAFGDSVFAGFSGDADCADGVLSPDGDKNCLARFDASAVPAVVSITKAGDGSGTVTSSPAGIDCGATCSAGFSIPSRVLLTATPDPGSAFVGWTGPADCADGNLDVTGDIACGAVFELQPARITVIKFGLGDGTVTSDPAGIDCGSTCSATFPGATSVTLSADPDGNSVFSGFSGDPDCADGVVTPDVDKTCFARFDTSVVPGTLSVTLAGSGSGRVTTDPAGVDCPGVCSAGFSIPTRVVLNAVADEGSEFVGWSGDADCADGNVEIGGDVDCTATFETVVTPSGFTLTVVYLGTSSGAVTSSPIGIFCEVSGCSAEFPSGTTVTLFARPLGSLGGWGGDCSGSSFSTSVVMDADKTCTITFDP